MVFMTTIQLRPTSVRQRRETLKVANASRSALGHPTFLEPSITTHRWPESRSVRKYLKPNGNRQRCSSTIGDQRTVPFTRMQRASGSFPREVTKLVASLAGSVPYSTQQELDCGSPIPLAQRELMRLFL